MTLAFMAKLEAAVEGRSDGSESEWCVVVVFGDARDLGSSQKDGRVLHQRDPAGGEGLGADVAAGALSAGH